MRRVLDRKSRASLCQESSPDIGSDGEIQTSFGDPYKLFGVAEDSGEVGPYLYVNLKGKKVSKEERDRGKLGNEALEGTYEDVGNTPSKSSPLENMDVPVGGGLPPYGDTNIEQPEQETPLPDQTSPQNVPQGFYELYYDPTTADPETHSEVLPSQNDEHLERHRSNIVLDLQVDIEAIEQSTDISRYDISDAAVYYQPLQNGTDVECLQKEILKLLGRVSLNFVARASC
eukprot:TRINITY_DN4762_c0_g1_i2.p1 TRINITY_DN4762_c0_g1~~TRINITY_DN4762_c0_g1_i2.p1  ORF type:complete len:230 (-),score=28.88 TRINITY_DN4762_c0_g1_i2:132-821(-)